ncbi:Tryptophan synthase alpha chain [Minicystis rosea]|nr:Tryptophan synthase alpha chain [Minicystis rosea]
MHGSKEDITIMLRLASLATLTLISSLALLACDPAVIANGTGGSGGTGTSSASGSGGHTADTCTQAGGTCVVIAPAGELCPGGTLGDPETYACGSDGMGCCLPKSNACEQAGGTCVADAPGACTNGTWGDASSCGSGVGVGCCIPKANACEQAGGTCVAEAPGACINGTWGDASSCGSGVGVGCCIPTVSCDLPCTEPGAQRCINGSVETCAAPPGTFCTPVWGQPEPCGAGKHCSADGKSCVPTTPTCNENTDCGCGCGCVAGLCECAGGLPPSCNGDLDCGPECSGFRCVANQCEGPVCQPGVDATCNDNSVMSALAGKCNADATCTCNAGYTKQASGKCG